MVTVVVCLISGFLWYARFSTFFWITGATTSTLPVPVSRLRTAHVLSTFLVIFVKYIFRPLGLVPKLEVKNGGAYGAPVALAALSISAKLEIDTADETFYDAATGQNGTSGRLMLLPALVNPLMSLLLANRNCAIFPLGCVNTGNRFEFIDVEACLDPCRILDLPNATVHAILGGPSMPGRRVKRGVEFDFVIEVSAPRKGCAPQNLRLVFRQLGTILAMIPGSGAIQEQPNSAISNALPRFQWAPVQQTLRIDPDAPWRWAALCRDYSHIYYLGKNLWVSGQVGTW